jgi:hypothetical protein
MSIRNPVQTPAAGEPAVRTSSHAQTAGEAKVCRTVLISDNPSDTDKFGTHRRVAQAIAEVITSDAEGVSIGVEGSWGSGKTTIYKLLESHFREKGNYAVIPFDAWAHEGDPLRLTFLQSILRDLETREWIKRARRECWKNKIEEIANRRQTEVTKDYPSLSGMGKAFSIALLFVPLSAAFANAALRDDKLTLLHGDISWRFVVLFLTGVVLTTFPLMILLLQWFSMSKKERQESSGPWALLFTKGVVENRKETQKTANPTSVDFEKTFEDLMKEALGDTPDSNRRLVLVIDNLDRVDSEVAQAIWSTLQTFLKHRSGDGAPWAKRLWVVALYDPRGLSLIWEKATPNEAAGPQLAANTEGAAPPSPVTADEPGVIAQSFMDKSFQMRFEVAAPVLSNWRDFLVGLLRDAFPDHRRPQPEGNGEGPPIEVVEEDFHAVYRVLAIHLNRRRLLPTIRELKLYVNQIGVVHRQWAANTESDPPRAVDAFSLPHMAYYTLLRRRGRDVVRDLLATKAEEKLPEAEYVDLLGEGIADNLAALAFNVEVKLARQLLISPELKNALGQGEPVQEEGTEQLDAAETLKGLAASYPKGFWEVLEETVREEWKGEESLKIAYAAYNLEQSGLLENAARPEIRNVTNSLSNQAGKVLSWSLSDERKAHGLAAILRWKRRRDGDSASAERYVADIMRAVAAGFLDRPSDVQKWSTLTKILLDDFSPGEVAGAFNMGLVHTLVEPLTREGYLPPHEMIGARLEALTELSAHSPFSALQLTSLAKSSRLLVLWGAASESYPAQAWVLFTYLREVPSAALPADAPDNVQQKHKLLMDKLREPVAQTLDEFTNLIKRYNKTNLLYDIQKQAPDAGRFVGFCLQRILEGEDAMTHLRPLDFYFNWSSIVAALKGIADGESALNNYIKRLMSEQPLVEFLSGYAFNYQQVGLYRRIIDNGGLSKTNFRDWFVANLYSLEQSHWQKDLMGEGELLRSAFEAQKAGAVIELGLNYQKALFAHVSALLSNRQKVSQLFFPEIEPTGLLDPKLHKTFRSSLYKETVGAVNAQSPVNPVYFEAYGRELLHASELQSDDDSYEDLFIPILETRHLSGLKWLEQVFTAYEKLRSDAKQADSIKRFKATLNGIPYTPENKATPHISNLRLMFGL